MHGALGMHRGFWGRAWGSADAHGALGMHMGLWGHAQGSVQGVSLFGSPFPRAGGDLVLGLLPAPVPPQLALPKEGCFGKVAVVGDL